VSARSGLSNAQVKYTSRCFNVANTMGASWHFSLLEKLHIL
jgi:hypothetical protein